MAYVQLLTEFMIYYVTFSGTDIFFEHDHPIFMVLSASFLLFSSAITGLPVMKVSWYYGAGPAEMMLWLMCDFYISLARTVQMNTTGIVLGNRVPLGPPFPILNEYKDWIIKFFLWLIFGIDC
jgi:hypothetical protein